MPPDLYLDARLSLERMKELTWRAWAKLVPDIAEDMSSVRAEDGLGGRLPFVGRGGGMPVSVESAGEDRCTLIFALVTLFGILIGVGVCFLAEDTPPWHERV